jgi:hypothetical protein
MARHSSGLGYALGPSSSDPPASALEEFRRQLSQIASELGEFARPPGDWQRDPQAVTREHRRQADYFDEHLAEDVLTACRALFCAWRASLLGTSNTSGLGIFYVDPQAARVARRRFPIMLRRHTPPPLHEAMEREEFEQLMRTALEESFAIGVPNRVPTGGQQTSPFSPTPTSPSKLRAGSVRVAQIRKIVDVPDSDWTRTHVYRALTILKSCGVSLHGVARSVAVDTADSHPEATLYSRIRRLSQRTEKRTSKTMTSEQAQLVPTLRRLLMKQVSGGESA